MRILPDIIRSQAEGGRQFIGIRRLSDRPLGYIPRLTVSNGRTMQQA